MAGGDPRAHALSLHGVALSLAADAEPDAGAPRAPRRARAPHRTGAGVGAPGLVHLARRLSPRPAAVPAHRAKRWRASPTTSRARRTPCGRRIAIENPSHYLQIDGHEWDEIDFLAELARRTGCGLLLDVNNVYVSARNLGYSAEAYLDAFPASW